MKQPLSVIITTFNEENNIRRVLDSVQWAEEILLIDSFSQDNTVTIARKYGATVHKRKYEGPADQKNWAIPLARHPWVLILDADEKVTAQLQTEIIAKVNDPENTYDAFWIRRQNYFLGRRIRYSGWQNDAVIRLIRRDRCRYNSKQVHEEIETAGIRVGSLSNPMEHFTFRDVTHFIDKMQRYARWSAQDYAHQTPKIGWFHLIIKPFFRFFKHFILQRGFLDGKRGFIISAIMAWGVFLRYLHLMERSIIHNKFN